jgi:ribosomal protein S27AE
MKKWNAEHPGYAAASVRARRHDPERVEELRQYDRDRYAESPEKKKARNAVLIRVARGTIVRPNKCERCGTETFTEAHHADYTKPLDVEWLCTECHIEHHSQEATK